jgi:hypothetical protein
MLGSIHAFFAIPSFFAAGRKIAQGQNGMSQPMLDICSASLKQFATRSLSWQAVLQGTDAGQTLQPAGIGEVISMTARAVMEYDKRINPSQSEAAVRGRRCGDV